MKFPSWLQPRSANLLFALALDPLVWFVLLLLAACWLVGFEPWRVFFED